MEVPSDYDGIIKEIKVKEGDSVKEGVVLLLWKLKKQKNKTQMT